MIERNAFGNNTTIMKSSWRTFRMSVIPSTSSMIMTSSNTSDFNVPLYTMMHSAYLRMGHSVRSMGFALEDLVRILWNGVRSMQHVVRPYYFFTRWLTSSNFNSKRKSARVDRDVCINKGNADIDLYPWDHFLEWKRWMAIL